MILSGIIRLENENIGLLPDAYAADGIVQPRVALFLSKSEQTTDKTGGTYAVSVSASSSWTATASVSWISFIVGSGTGNGAVNYVVASCPNSTVYREGTITVISGMVVRTLTVIQRTDLVWPVANGSGIVKYNRASGLNTSKDVATTVNGVTYAAKEDIVCGAGDITSFYGARFSVADSKYKRHWAIDIDVGTSTDMVARAALCGTVSEVGYEDEKGYYVYIRHLITKNGATTTLYTRYLHLANYTVSKGDTVTAGQKIGIVGETGSANGDLHLHFAIAKTIGNKNYLLNPVAYYHGSDDRGIVAGDNASLAAYNNNPMFIISAGKWVPNPDWDPAYSDFTGTGSVFYSQYMNAIRGGNIIEICAQ